MQNYEKYTIKENTRTNERIKYGFFICLKKIRINWIFYSRWHFKCCGNKWCYNEVVRQSLICKTKMYTHKWLFKRDRKGETNQCEQYLKKKEVTTTEWERGREECGKKHINNNIKCIAKERRRLGGWMQTNAL